MPHSRPPPMASPGDLTVMIGRVQQSDEAPVPGRMDNVGLVRAGQPCFLDFFFAQESSQRRHFKSTWASESNRMHEKDTKFMDRVNMESAHAARAKDA